MKNINSIKVHQQLLFYDSTNICILQGLSSSDEYIQVPVLGNMRLEIVIEQK